MIKSFETVLARKESIAPGAVATYDFLTVAALPPFAVENNQAVALALVLHAILYVMFSAFGLVCLGADSLSLRELVIKVRIQKEEKV